MITVIEIVFSDSASESLRAAHHYGDGKHQNKQCFRKLQGWLQADQRGN